MVTADCPWCEAPVPVDQLDVLRCQDCRVEVEIDPRPEVADVALAA